MDVVNPKMKVGWRQEREEASLSDVYRSVETKNHGSRWRRMAAFAGPGYMVAVGYMDPGNWATSLAGGSKFGYALLTVALLSNLMAIVLQSLCAVLPSLPAAIWRRPAATPFRNMFRPALGLRRNRHHRDRHCRGHRHGDRSQPDLRDLA
jgi:hypothetical protein